MQGEALGVKAHTWGVFRRRCGVCASGNVGCVQAEAHGVCKRTCEVLCRLWCGLCASRALGCMHGEPLVGYRVVGVRVGGSKEIVHADTWSA